MMYSMSRKNPIHPSIHPSNHLRMTYSMSSLTLNLTLGVLVWDDGGTYKNRKESTCTVWVTKIPHCGLRRSDIFWQLAIGLTNKL